MFVPINQGRKQQELSRPGLEGGQDPYSDAGHLPMYGGTGSSIVKSPYFQWRRRRLNLVAVFVCLFVPWLLFCFVFWLTSFSLFYWHPALCFLIAALVLVFVIFLGAKALDAVKKSRSAENDQPKEPTWYVFLFVTCLLAWALAMYMGSHNFYYRMQPYYSIQNLGNYKGVDVEKTPGEQLMDGGRLVFKEGTHLDLSKSMSFRNNDLYCVAPIVGPNYTWGGAPESYDYWAVGVNCCCGDTVRNANFQCGEFKNNKATAGVRLMRDEERPFYRLAVEQAVGSFGIRAKHPLFFHWVADPVAASEAYSWEGHREYLIGAYAHFAFQIVLVCLTALGFAREK